MTAGAGADAARTTNIVAHIEAGVRSFAPEPWPEEELRVGISHVADVNFCPTQETYDNLEKGRKGGSASYVTGNTIVSSLAEMGIQPCNATEPKTILITLHRRELRDDPQLPDIVAGLFKGMRRFSETRFLWPMHPAMRHIDVSNQPDNLEITGPLSYLTFLLRLSTCEGVITDSGGVIEEAATLGVPTIIFRKYNDRPEAERKGIALRETPSFSGGRSAVRWLVTNLIPRKPSFVFGQPDAAAKIAQHLSNLVET
ncbi:hypothetical protein LCGC14_1994150 [marine sediment metagenome]|uniref:UDP-N-acetylglucosamine 2-epimerase domain-containing protein n=1 Tax=marine sediment metagenome TaxID=412755 RepID=A0A0F9FT73_9ZZZZ